MNTGVYNDMVEAHATMPNKLELLLSNNVAKMDNASTTEFFVSHKTVVWLTKIPLVKMSHWLSFFVQ